MKILFVSSGNSKNFDIAPFIKAQGKSLEKAGLDVHYFPIKGKGVNGYIRAGLKLRQYLKSNHFDLVHAHFTLSGWAAVIGAGKIPVILSLMGTDAQGDYTGFRKIRLRSRLYMALTQLIQPFVRAIISKSQNIADHVYLKGKSHIIPNGINTGLFKPYDSDFREELGLQPNKKYVLFLGDRHKSVKNYALAEKAVALLNMPDVELINPYPLAHDAIPKYLNSVNVLVVPSFMEGSPNVVKEAMACNCPIVATDVGDIRWVMGATAGCHIAGFDASDFAEKIFKAVEFSQLHGRTAGQVRIQELQLNSESVARRLISLYEKVSHVNAPIKHLPQFDAVSNI